MEKILFWETNDSEMEDDETISCNHLSFVMYEDKFYPIIRITTDEVRKKGDDEFTFKIVLVPKYDVKLMTGITAKLIAENIKK